MISPHKTYKLLLKAFGPRGWWPLLRSTELRKGDACKPVYHPGRYKVQGENEIFEVCVGAILTQNTAWVNVEKAICNLNAKKALNLQSFLKMPKKKLASLIRSSGYYNQKAERLKSFAGYIIKRYGRKEPMRKLFAKPTAGLRTELLSLKGIGPETADSMLLYAGAKRTFVVDAYTMRIAQRLGWFKNYDYENAKAYIEKLLPKTLKVYNEFHALIVELGKNFCRKKPLCGDCPIDKRCRKIGVVK